MHRIGEQLFSATEIESDDSIGTVKQIMGSAFAKWCPGVSARITHGPFS
jgi:hypothetical protein